MFASNPDNTLLKLPTPEPFDVLKLSIVGLWLVFQQTPRSVTGLPPSFSINPPDVTLDSVIFPTEDVVNDAGRILTGGGGVSLSSGSFLQELMKPSNTIATREAEITVWLKNELGLFMMIKLYFSLCESKLNPVIDCLLAQDNQVFQ